MVNRIPCSLENKNPYYPGNKNPHPYPPITYFIHHRKIRCRPTRKYDLFSNLVDSLKLIPKKGYQKWQICSRIRTNSDINKQIVISLNCLLFLLFHGKISFKRSRDERYYFNFRINQSHFNIFNDNRLHSNCCTFMSPNIRN